MYAYIYMFGFGLNRTPDNMAPEVRIYRSKYAACAYIYIYIYAQAWMYV